MCSPLPTTATAISSSTASLAKKRRTAFVAPAPPPSLVSSLANDSNRKSVAAITNLLDADPEFYLHVEQVSLAKLRRDAMETRSASREPHPVAFQDALPQLPRLTPAKTTPVDKLNTGSNRGDVRWRTLVRLSYQKAKFCARLLRVGQKENSRRATTVVPPAGLNKVYGAGVEASPLRTGSVVELSVTPGKKEEKRRGRSRSDAFIIPANLWRPNASMFLSNSAPAATPSAVSCAAEWTPSSHVLAA